MIAKTGGPADSGCTIFVLNGPNLNLLGTRQPEIYGRKTLADIEADCRRHTHGTEYCIDFRQSNAEHELIGWVHEARGVAAGIVINPAALTHTSIAMLDALNTFEGPVVEVHLSNIHRREAFRHHSYISLRAETVIAGAGCAGYLYAISQIMKLEGSNR